MKLPDLRQSITHKAVIYSEPELCPHCAKPIVNPRVKFFFTIGLTETGEPAELFMHMDESGTTLDGFCDAFGIAVSLMLRYEVPLDKIIEKFGTLKFLPQGRTDNPDIRFAHSIIDYVIKFMKTQWRKEEKTTI